MVASNLKDKFKNGELDLSSSGLKEIPFKEIMSLKHITSLNLSNNKISSVGRGIGNMTHLTKLDLSKNHIKGLPENIGNLTNLKHLNLSHNQISILPPSMGNLKSLKYLDIKNNHLTQKFSDIVGSCQNESQCQQAAKNILRTLSSSQSQSDVEKKKKPKENEVEPKKKKTDKKTQNGGINNQTKPKERKQKKSNKGVFGKIFGSIYYLCRNVVITILIVSFFMYALSFYYENPFKVVKAQIYPIWHSTLTSIMNEDSALEMEITLGHICKMVSETITNSFKFIFEFLKRFYVYISTDETIHGYIKNTKIYLHDKWDKLISNDKNLKS